MQQHEKENILKAIKDHFDGILQERGIEFSSGFIKWRSFTTRYVGILFAFTSHLGLLAVGKFLKSL